jgi:membrane protein DedA with SNARE-associated domain
MQFCEATGLIGQIVEFALGIISVGGWLGVAGIVLVENVLPFIPSEVILPAIGFAAASGIFQITGISALIAAILVTTLASVFGAIILFQISRAIGVHRVAKLPLVDENGLQRAENVFAKYGAAAVFFCRFLPVVRVLVTIPAGLSNMKKRQFILFTALGSLIWNIIFVTIGYSVGTSWCGIEPVFSRYSKVVLIVMVALFVVAWLIKRKLHSTPKQTDASIDDANTENEA